MRASARIGVTILLSSLVWLLGGCATQGSSAYGRQPLNDFEVVETSSKRRLTTREMAVLRARVVDYLEQQGETGTGDFYVKINLGEEPGVAKGEWVVVRFTRYPSALSGRLASYESTGYPTYPSYQYDYFPFGWMGFSAFSFRYYDDPYYSGYAGHYPRPYYPYGTAKWRDHHRRPGGYGHHGNVSTRPHGWSRGRDGDKRRWPHRPGFNFQRPDGLPPPVIPSLTPRPRWEQRPESRPGERNRDFRRERRPGFERPNPAYRPAVPPVAPSLGERPPPTTIPPRSGGQRERGPAYAPPNARVRGDAPQPMPPGRERDTSPRARPESSDSSRPTESPRQDRSGQQYDSGRSRGETAPVQRPVLQDGGRRAREP